MDVQKLQHPDPLRGLDPSRTTRPGSAGEDLGTTAGAHPSSLRATSRSMTPPRMGATRMRGQKDLLGATTARSPSPELTKVRSKAVVVLSSKYVSGRHKF